MPRERCFSGPFLHDGVCRMCACGCFCQPPGCVPPRLGEIPPHCGSLPFRDVSVFAPLTSLVVCHSRCCLHRGEGGYVLTCLTVACTNHFFICVALGHRINCSMATHLIVWISGFPNPITDNIHRPPNGLIHFLPFFVSIVPWIRVVSVCVTTASGASA